MINLNSDENISHLLLPQKKKIKGVSLHQGEEEAVEEEKLLLKMRKRI
jgi:hypothetical protein